MKHQAQSNGEFRILPGDTAGYDTEEVNSFFTRLADDYELMLSGEPITRTVHTSRTIRQQDFTAQPGGYDPADVDRALDRVEDRFAEIERRNYIGTNGVDAWNDTVADLRALLLGRLDRPAGERFRRPAARLTKGYFVKDVDALCDRLAEHLCRGQQLTPADVRRAAFGASTGSMSYDETQVDAFMDRAIEYIQDTL